MTIFQGLESSVYWTDRAGRRETRIPRAGSSPVRGNKKRRARDGTRSPDNTY